MIDPRSAVELFGYRILQFWNRIKRRILNCCGSSDVDNFVLDSETNVSTDGERTGGRELVGLVS